VTVALPPAVTVEVCSATFVAIGLHSLYVGVPNAELVLLDRFR
jgi:hypothetical protein